MTSTRPSPEFDVAVSFAGEDRAAVEPIVRMLQDAGVTVFYDEDHKATLWGRDLAEELGDIYARRALVVVVFISRHYVAKPWPRHEKRSALATGIGRPDDDYVLPVRLDDSELSGLPSSIAYLDLRTDSSSEVVEHILSKLRAIDPSSRQDSAPPERSTEPRKVSVSSIASESEGAWAIEYEVTNGSSFPVHDAVVVVSDPGGQTDALAQEGAALEIVVGTVNPGKSHSGSSDVRFIEEPSFGELTHLTTLLFVDSWDQSWAADGSHVVRNPHRPRIC